MKWLSKTWQIDPRLEKDTILISSNGAWQTRLMNDSRWPWIIVVPVTHDVEEIDEYHRGGMEPLIGHLANISATLKKMGAAESTNVATLGNVVKQMHWHVVGRRENDPNWPGPVWGYEKAIPYGKGDAHNFVEAFKKAMGTWLN